MSQVITREEAQERKGRRGSAFTARYPDQAQAIQEYWTPERRQAKREEAKRLIAEGKFGGRQPGAGRPRIKTVSEVIAEEAQKDGKKIYRELQQMVLNNKSHGIKLGAIDRILKAEQDVLKNMRDDERDIASLGGKDLQNALFEELVALGADIDLSDEDIEEITDVETA